MPCYGNRRIAWVRSVKMNASVSSFGCPAIFLLGGTTRSTKPVAMCIRSGDVVVMSGPARLAYHAVPRILPKETNCGEERVRNFHRVQDLDRECSCGCKQLLPLNEKIHNQLESLEWSNFRIYLETSRINLNVRQVLQPGQTCLEDNTDTEEDDNTPLHKMPKVT